MTVAFEWVGWPTVVAVAWFRFPGLSAALRDALPHALAPVASAVTTLGDPELLIGVLAVLYWVHRRRETATVASAAFVALVAVMGLKHALALPRPPMTVRPLPVTPGSSGFPSGHATSATVVYGGLAVAYGWTDRRTLVAVAGLVAAVALSRVLLGVHYLGDVLAGVVLGAVVLAGLAYWIRDRPRRGFLAASVLAVPALVVVGPIPDAVLALGGSVGGLVAMQYFEVVPPLRSRVEAAVVTVVGLALVALLRGLAAAFATLVPALFVVDFLLVVAVFQAPTVVGHLPDRWLGE
ncbi:MAG: phosphatase PAP2 family protein [Haloarculaceae archaeon]